MNYKKSSMGKNCNWSRMGKNTLTSLGNTGQLSLYDKTFSRSPLFRPLSRYINLFFSDQTTYVFSTVCTGSRMQINFCEIALPICICLAVWG